MARLLKARGISMRTHGIYIMAFVACSMLASCSVPVHRVQDSPDVKNRAVVQADTGEDVARHLTARYSDTRANCGSDSQPAFLCNGVLIRGTSSNPSYHVWENSPASLEKGGVSVSYLRADSNFNKLAFGYNNGFVLAAYYYASEKLHPEVLCFFPIDADTVNRSNKGCGENSGFAGSGPCHLQGVNTAAQFWTHYSAHASSRHAYQCGFDVTDARDALAGPAFAAGLGAMSLMGAESFAEQNEFIVAAWGNGLGRSLPLEAFFYIENSGGLATAQRNQQDLEATDGIRIPIISVKLPQASGQAASFYFRDADQSTADPNDGELGPAGF